MTGGETNATHSGSYTRAYNPMSRAVPAAAQRDEEDNEWQCNEHRIAIYSWAVSQPHQPLELTGMEGSSRGVSHLAMPGVWGPQAGVAPLPTAGTMGPRVWPFPLDTLVRVLARIRSLPTSTLIMAPTALGGLVAGARLLLRPTVRHQEPADPRAAGFAQGQLGSVVLLQAEDAPRDGPRVSRESFVVEVEVRDRPV